MFFIAAITCPNWKHMMECVWNCWFCENVCAFGVMWQVWLWQCMDNVLFIAFFELCIFKGLGWNCMSPVRGFVVFQTWLDIVFSGREDFLFEWGMIEDFELLSVLVCCPLPGINRSGLFIWLLVYCFSSIPFVGDGLWNCGSLKYLVVLCLDWDVLGSV